MRELIPKHIADNEILVHYIFDRNFKNKHISEEKLISKDIFIPNKGGVSLQRNFYCDESRCKELAKNVAVGKVYVGFIIFRKSYFEKVKRDYILNDRKEFDAEIISTPLDENFEYLLDEIQIFTDTLGNPAHADLRYINPAPTEHESPNTAIRSFSRKLSKNCKLIIDGSPTANSYDDVPFNGVI